MTKQTHTEPNSAEPVVNATAKPNGHADVAKLDYENATIWMVAETQIERDVRIHSASKEKETVAWIQSLPLGGIFLDVGANVGAYTLVAGACGQSVVAFEPAPANFLRLTQNVALNGLHVICMPFACWDRTMLLPLNGDDTPGQTHAVGGPNSLLVLGMPMDSIVAAMSWNVLYMKVDVDGGEVSVLRGARETLKHVDSLLVETIPSTEDEVADLLIAAGLELIERFPHASGVTNEVWFRPGAC